MPGAIVIGGSVAGLTAGAELAEGGVQVTLLERETALGYHASGRSAAMFEMGYGPAAVQRLTEASEAEYVANDILSPRGLILVGRADQATAFDADVAALGLIRISTDQALGRVPILNPDALAFAALSPTARDLDTDRVLQGAAKRLRAAGGRIVTGAEVHAIRQNAGGWTVSAGDEHAADLLINAAGAWADQVATLAHVAPIGLQPKRRSMARLPAPGGHDVTGWPMLMGVDESWYAKPDAGGWIVSPSEAHPIDPCDAWPDDMVLAEGIARYEAMVSEPVTRLETSWAGLRTFPPDGVPAIGPDPDHPGFIWCAGQGGYGFQTAPAAGRLTAALALGAAPQLDAATVAALNPARFR
ncbi:MAG: FAD-dependent oxidoreductase [Rhodobacteraceae bacterium]|nr:FAD-dependent oxidoreductase [Paracoccaceae bacterium]